MAHIARRAERRPFPRPTKAESPLEGRLRVTQKDAEWMLARYLPDRCLELPAGAPLSGSLRGRACRDNHAPADQGRALAGVLSSVAAPDRYSGQARTALGRTTDLGPI